MNFLKSSLFLALALQASKIEMYDIIQDSFFSNGYHYTIKASLQYIDLDSFKKHIFWGRKRLFAHSNFIQDGVFIHKNFKIAFKKFFRINATLFFQKVSFRYKNYTIEAKECRLNIFHSNILRCRNVQFFSQQRFYYSKVAKTFVLP